MTVARRPFPMLAALLALGGYAVLGVLWLALPHDPTVVPTGAKAVALVACCAAGGGVVAIGDWWGSDR